MSGPPPVPRIEPPTDNGADALRFLRECGFTIQDTPTIRSSDFNLSFNPFLYFLRRRLGFTNPLSFSEALTKGSFFHTAFELDPLTGPLDTLSKPPFTTAFDRRLTARLSELKTICNTFGIIGSPLTTILDTERRIAREALALYESACSLPITYQGLNCSARDYLLRPYWTPLDRELILRVPHQSTAHNATVMLVAQPDLLLFNSRKNEIWILDAKTTADPTTTRLAFAPIEFQTRHYLHIARTILPDLIALYELPPNTTIGGFIHWAVQKPPIIMGRQDCPIHRIHNHSTRKKSAQPLAEALPRFDPLRSRLVYPCSGYSHVPDPSRLHLMAPDSSYLATSLEEASSWIQEFTGKKTLTIDRGTEPSHDSYLERCRDWFLGRNEYAEKSAEREAQPPSNFSFVSATLLDRPSFVNYNRDLEHLIEMATRPAHPDLYPCPTSTLTSRGGRLNDLSFLCNSPIVDWPALVRDNNIIQSFREDTTARETGRSTILRTSTP